jgi:hypothetical protein
MINEKFSSISDKPKFGGSTSATSDISQYSMNKKPASFDYLGGNLEGYRVKSYIKKGFTLRRLIRKPQMFNTTVNIQVFIYNLVPGFIKNFLHL